MLDLKNQTLYIRQEEGTSVTIVLIPPTQLEPTILILDLEQVPQKEKTQLHRRERLHTSKEATKQIPYIQLHCLSS